MAALNSAVGSYSTLSLNIGDFTRYAKRPRDQFAQVLVIPVCFTATALMGVAIASGGYKVHGLAKIQFDPTRLMNNWSTDSGLERAGLFFFGFAMALSNLGSNSAFLSLRPSLLVGSAAADLLKLARAQSRPTRSAAPTTSAPCASLEALLDERARR